jgi:phosphoglycolate phosphatase
MEKCRTTHHETTGLKMKKLPDAIIYDWDNTLIDSWQSVLQSVNYIFAHYGKPQWTLEDMMHKSHRSAKDMMPEEFGEQWEEAYHLFYAHVGENHCKNLMPLPFSHDVLVFFQTHQIPQYVISNKKGTLLRAEVDHLGWGHFFNRVIGSADYIHDKPHPDIVAFTLDGKSFEDIWFVGDTPVDWECAKTSNCYAVSIVDRVYDSLTKADIIFPSMETFYNQLIDLNKKL